LLLGLISLGGGLNTGSILLMLLGTQWYILFNVIAGAIAIPSEFREVAEIFRFSRLDRWRTVILPAIFPYLITGLVTASGGEWNASILLSTFGPGRRNQLSHRRGKLRSSSSLHHRDGHSGSFGEPAGVASALPPRRDALPHGSVTILAPVITDSASPFASSHKRPQYIDAATGGLPSLSNLRAIRPNRSSLCTRVRRYTRQTASGGWRVTVNLKPKQVTGAWRIPP
jgi:hypothetical protein